MAVFDHMPMGEEGLKEIYAWIDEYVKRNRTIAEKIVLGRSEDDKWEVPAVIITNRSVPEDEKHNAIVTLARHGQERGARVVGPEILEYLASDAASETRNKQTVVVVPIVNPTGVIRDEFHSSLHGITDHEKKIFGVLCSRFIPDMMIDYHSLGKSDATKYDRGDMEVIIPANTTRWGMDEQIYSLVSGKMVEACAAAGWPYEIHSLEDLNYYYFGDARTGRRPHKYMQEKVFLLHIQNFSEHYDFPKEPPGYTNYTNGPAYLKWHTMIFGVETNHWSISPAEGLGESGLLPCQALLNMGNSRFPWEHYSGYPTNLVDGDFRISIRATGKTPGERRSNREKIWKERVNFEILKRVMLDNPEETLVDVGYIGNNVPLDLELSLRMRQNTIRTVTVADRPVEFDTVKDNCSTYLFIPLSLTKAGLSQIKVTHEPFRKNE